MKPLPFEGVNAILKYEDGTGIAVVARGAREPEMDIEHDPIVWATDTTPVPEGGAHSLLLHRELMAQRLRIQAMVRFVVAGGIVVSAWGAKHLVGIDGLDVPSLVVLASFLALFNLGTVGAIRRCAETEPECPYERMLHGLMHLTISVDFVFLTVALWIVGGTNSPFKAFYLIHVFLAAILLSPRAAMAHALFGYVLLSGLVLAEYSGWVPARYPIGAVNTSVPMDGRFAVTVVVVQGFLMGLTVFLATGLAQLLRQGEQRLRAANAELTQLSTLRRDFLHITIHDLKAPANAAAMLLQNLTAGLGGPLTEQQEAWLERCQIRLRELSALLRDFEILTMLDAETIRKQAQPIDPAALIRALVEENEDLAHARGHHIEAVADGALPSVYGIERLVREAVANLITNAVKYTPEGGRIAVAAASNGRRVYVQVSDTGVGISAENQQRLFQEFVRIGSDVRRAGGVPGTGLGLSIVRRIVDLHGGRVGVRSEPGQGSMFVIELPAHVPSSL